MRDSAKGSAGPGTRWLGARIYFDTFCEFLVRCIPSKRRGRPSLRQELQDSHNFMEQEAAISSLGIVLQEADA
jgi:hypothetical protein